MFTRLTLDLVEQMRNDGVSFVFNTPNDQSRPGYLKMGWSDVARVPVSIRPMRPVNMVRKKLAGADEVGEVAASAMHGIDLIDDLCAETGLPDFLNGLHNGESRYHTGRTVEYLRWRYGAIPGFDYRARSRIVGGVGAVVVYRHRTRDRMSELSFAEVLVSPGGEGIRLGAQLLREVMRESPADYAAACAAKGTGERGALLRAGFLPVGLPGPRFTVNPLQAQLTPDPLAWPSWRTSVGDLELF